MFAVEGDGVARASREGRLWTLRKTKRTKEKREAAMSAMEARLGWGALL